jgi:hypothetical protein
MMASKINGYTTNIWNGVNRLLGLPLIFRIN